MAGKANDGLTPWKSQPRLKAFHEQYLEIDTSEHIFLFGKGAHKVWQ